MTDRDLTVLALGYAAGCAVTLGLLYVFARQHRHHPAVVYGSILAAPDLPGAAS